jgi:hypothetical protein
MAAANQWVKSDCAPRVSVPGAHQEPHLQALLSREEVTPGLCSPLCCHDILGSCDSNMQTAEVKHSKHRLPEWKRSKVHELPCP